jgi:hypothetical protein
MSTSLMLASGLDHYRTGAGARSPEPPMKRAGTAGVELREARRSSERRPIRNRQPAPIVSAHVPAVHFPDRSARARTILP